MTDYLTNRNDTSNFIGLPRVFHILSFVLKFERNLSGRTFDLDLWNGRGDFDKLAKVKGSNIVNSHVVVSSKPFVYKTTTVYSAISELITNKNKGVIKFTMIYIDLTRDGIPA